MFAIYVSKTYHKSNYWKTNFRTNIWMIINYTVFREENQFTAA